MVYLFVSSKPGSIPWNKGQTKETNKSVKKISDTFKSKGIDNFSKWRKSSKLSGRIPDNDKPLRKSEELAFLIGLTLGDGNISKFTRTECLRLTLGTDKPNLATYAVETIERVFNKTPSIIKRTNSNCFNVTIYQKNIALRLQVPPVSRGNLDIKLPDWIWCNKSFLISALKGLFEAEASYCVHNATYTYNFEFSNRNTSLLNEVERGLVSLGFHPERRIHAVRIRKKAEAISFYDLIRFRTYP